MEHQDKLIDFARFLKPVQDYLLSHGIVAEFSGRNDLLVDGYKVSGNAEHVFQRRKRVIHHGTLLYDTKLEDLGSAIHPLGLCTYSSKAVQSVRSKVRNLKEGLDKNISSFDFMRDMGKYFENQISNSGFDLTDKVEQIRAIQSEKYRTWDWNYGYSPNYEVSIPFAEYGLISLKVRKGLISSAILEYQEERSEIAELIGMRHKAESFERVFSAHPIISKYIPKDFSLWF